MWRDLEKISGKRFILKNGCFNIAKKDVTPNLSRTYAEQSYSILKKLGFKTKYFENKQSLKKIFPQFDADIGCVDIDAGFLYIPTIMSILKKQLRKRGVKIYENSEVVGIKEIDGNVVIKTNNEKIYKAKNVNLSVGVWAIRLIR